MMSPRRKNNGFTLIELMVALILATIVVAPLYVVTRSLTGQAKLEQVETEAMQRARIGLHTLLNDLAMTGLHASPNPIDDPRSFLFNGNQGDGLHRHAVVHLNPNDTDLSDGEDDSMLLVGNFFGGRSYSAIYTGSGEFNTYKPVTGDADLITDEECTLSGFMVRGGYYSYAHVERADGKTLDVPVTDAAFANGICTVTVDMTGIPENAVTPGDTVYLSANQAALYRVEGITFDDGFVRRDLVRHFVNYDGSSVGACSIGTGGTIEIVANTRQVIAEYVALFQVWFRPVRQVSGTPVVVPNAPNFYDIDTLAASNLPVVPDRNSIHVLLDAPTDTPGADDVTCFNNSGTIEAQHIRSAVVLLSVHSEKSDLELDDTVFGAAASRFVRLSAQNCTTGPCALAPSAYKLKTVVTEVDMPNLAARSDIL